MQSWFTAPFFAAYPTTLDRLRYVPRDTWINAAIFVISAFVLVKTWKTLRRVNDYAPYIACVVFGCGVFFYWVYSRTEPAFLTPVVERLTPFFPTKSAQQDSLDTVRRSREN